jgi:hypothetical protein
MNTNETKGQIWNMCIQRGVFDKVKGEDFKKIQEIFEKIIKSYEEFEPSPDIFNKVIDSIILDVQKQNNGKTASFEDIQKEYDLLLKNPVPKKIDFTMNESENNIIGLSSSLSSLGSNQNTEYVTNQDQTTQISKIFNQSHNQNQNNQIQSQTSNIKLEEILMTQNKILIQILETQVKIIQGLKL